MTLSTPVPRILLADDDEGFRVPLAELLRREGFECVVVGNASDAIRALNAQTFDLLISDIKMPGNPNLELIRQVPQIADGLPVILLTGYPTVQTASAAVSLPVVAYLTKPLEFEILLSHATAAIARHHRQQAILSQRERLIQWSCELEDIADMMKSAPGKTDGRFVDAYAAITVRNALETLIGLRDFTEKTGKDASSTGPNSAELVTALQQTISVLEQTKQNFKSKRLGDLRQYLEEVVSKAALLGSPEKGSAQAGHA